MRLSHAVIGGATGGTGADELRIQYGAEGPDLDSQTAGTNQVRDRFADPLRSTALQAAFYIRCVS